MKKTKKSLFNMLFGIGNQLIILIFGLVVPRLFIVSYGSEVNGLQSSIAYIYTYIALLESGIGTATVQALFGAISRDSKNEINSVMSATNIQYKRIAKIYFLCMLIFAGIYPFCISTNISRLTVAGVVLLSGVNSLISFLAYGKFVLLLQADGRSYIVSIVSLIHYVLNSVIKIVLIMVGCPFIFVYVGSACLALLNLFIYYFYRKKKYPWVDYKVKPKMEAISQSKNVLVHQISNTICNSTDVIILTFIVRDLCLVSVYNIYIMIFDAVKSLVSNIFSSVTFIMGQTYNADINKYRRYHKFFEVADIAGSFALYSIAYVMMTPFLEVYTAGVTDISYIDKYLPLLFALTKLLHSGREPVSQLINYAGHFKQTQWRSVLEMAINIVVSLIASYYLGIYGVLLGTVAALGYRTIDMYLYTSKRFLDRSIWASFKQWFVYMSAFAIVIFVNSKIELHAANYIDFFIKAAVCGIVMIVFYTVYTCIFNFDVVKTVANVLLGRLKGRKASI